jgi:DNA end-binding protein Ku
VGEGYYLEASTPAAGKPYVLLRKALERSAKAAVAKYALRGRERLGLLRIRDDVIVLHAMKWDDEIRDPAAVAPEAVEVSEEEIEGAELLIDHMTNAGSNKPSGSRSSKPRRSRAQPRPPSRRPLPASAAASPSPASPASATRTSRPRTAGTAPTAVTTSPTNHQDYSKPSSAAATEAVSQPRCE